MRLALGDEYADYNLVITGRLGTPTEGARIEKALNELITANDLPKVVFHSLRHSSITYKLKLNGGDIKAVQGDSGHAQAKMVTDQYSHILDENRVSNAHLLEKPFTEEAVPKRAWWRILTARRKQIQSSNNSKRPAWTRRHLFRF